MKFDDYCFKADCPKLIRTLKINAIEEWTSYFRLTILSVPVCALNVALAWSLSLDNVYSGSERKKIRLKHMYTRFQYNQVYSCSMYFDTANQFSPQCNTQSVKINAPS